MNILRIVVSTCCILMMMTDLPQDARLTKRNGPQTLEMIADIAAKEKEKLEEAAAIVMGARKEEAAAPQEAKAPQSRIFGAGAVAE